MRALLKSMSQCISSLNTFKLTWLHWLQARRSSVRWVDKCPEATSTQGLGTPEKAPLPAFQGDVPVRHPSAGTALGLVAKITQMHQYLEENTEQQLLSFTVVMLWTLKTRSTCTEGLWRWEVITGLYPHKPFPCNSSTPSHDHTSFTFTSWTHLPWCRVLRGLKSLAKLKWEMGKKWEEMGKHMCTVTGGPKAK